MTEWNAIVIGAGHNGLACAAYLARRGLRVLVLESRDAPGGMAATREFAPGFHAPVGAHLVTHLNPVVARELKLEQHGLAWAARDLRSVAPAEGAAPLVFDGNSVSGLEGADRGAWSAFRERTRKYATLLDRFFSRPFPSLVERGWDDTIALAALGWRMKRLGQADMQELLRIGLSSIYDVANEHFASPLLKGAIALDAVLGSGMGPRSPATVYTYLHRQVGSAWGMRGPALVRGGMGALGSAFATAAQALGAEIRCGTPVESILVEEGRAAGVVLGDGSELRADCVVSGADPKTTFAGLLGYRELDAGFARRIENFRSRGVAAKLHLALDGLPEFPGLDTAAGGQRLLLAGDMDEIETAFNASKYGEHSARPVMEVVIPSVHDDSLAPPGKHLLSAVLQYAPLEPEAGLEACRESLLSAALDRLEAAAPGIRGRISAAELLLPADLENEFGMTGGHWHHGEMAMDQVLFTRPVPGTHQYASPVPGLYLCGAGSHPGGGVMGLAGRNAAGVVFKTEGARA